MPATKTHDPSQIHATFAGRALLTGCAEGEFLTTEFLHELYTLKVGADGVDVEGRNFVGVVEVGAQRVDDVRIVLQDLQI